MTRSAVAAKMAHDKTPTPPAALPLANPTTPPCSEMIKLSDEIEADDGSRTRDLELGKLALYQLSYVRAKA